ncbi:MAG TPA: selenocysteine-specific translation elongation factor [Acidimicrobiales bacterium]|nr:selenocysteine-specific translation elongation factor [Acidimicrobiales bacterium]
MTVVATAGHVDHGKSTLVHALTGTDPDRFREEKERGLTIDLGFAWTTLASGRELSFVDVPGHVRFIKNMLAGAGAVEACLFVVAATEGWKPQSEEHLRILELLGVAHGMVALTKVGLVDEETEELARLELADQVAGTFLEDAEVVAVDAPTGRGLDELRSALDRLLAGTPDAADRGRPRLWIDRVFPVRGAGTVVTGTLAGGPLGTDDAVEIVPAGHGRASGATPLTARVRGLQSHQRRVDRLGPGHRTAVNLAGVPHDRLWRGQAVVRPGQWAPTRAFDASLTVLASLGHEVTRRGAYHLYAGAGEHPVAIRLLGGGVLSPGEAGFARIHLPLALPLLPGDRFVLRESGRAETVGGGEVLDVSPVLPASRARPDRSVDRVVTERGWVEASLLERLTGVRVEPNVGGRWVASPEALEAVVSSVRAKSEGAGPLGLDPASLTERERAVLDRVGTPAPAPELDVPWLSALEAEPFSPPPPDGVDRALVRELVKRGQVVERDGIHFAPNAVARAAEVVASLLARQPEGVTASEIREALGTTRKYLLPLLGHLDATGVTRRRGDVRIAGPRLPAPAVSAPDVSGEAPARAER